MRLLLDENLPNRLKLDFEDHEIFSIREMGWNGIKNGELMKLLIENKFDALLTFDKNLQYQQNFSKYSICVFILTATINRYSVLTTLTPIIKKYLDSEILPLGPTIIQQE